MRREKNGYFFTPVRQKRSHAGTWIIVLCLLIASISLCILMNTSINTRVNLKSDTITVKTMDSAYEGFTILHISDLHASSIGSDFESWRELLYGKHYHAVVMTGDMVGKSGEYEPFISLIHTLTQLNNKAPIYFIAGDEDPEPLVTTFRGSQDVLAPWVQAGIQSGGIYLDNPESTVFNGKTIWIVPEYLYSVDSEGMIGALTAQKNALEMQGSAFEADGSANYRALNYRITSMQQTQLAIKQMKKGQMQIAVTHAPLDIEYIKGSQEWSEVSNVFSFRNIDAMLAGHYCGGQWRLPGGKILYMPELGWFPDAEDVFGLTRINSLNLHISEGIGASGVHPLPGRFFNPPTVSLL